MRIEHWVGVLFLFGALCASAEDAMTVAEKQVFDREKAFAQTMAERDIDAFGGFISNEGIFLGNTALRGRTAVVEAWASYFEGESAPFSWEPETVLVLDSGDLALSTGPVYNSEGIKTAIFTTTWRQEEPGVWRVVFDRGNKACD